MEYEGRYEIFDAGSIRTYPVAGRPNKVTRASLVGPDAAMSARPRLADETRKHIDEVARAIVDARRNDRAVICFAGAHLVKNGLGPLLADMAERGFVTLVGGNGATAIHDFELALMGETSENVPAALPEGRFGMAYEFAYFNAALKVGDEEKLGLGESLGRTICDDDFRRRVAAVLGDGTDGKTPLAFPHAEVSLLAGAYRAGVPMTILVGIGTDVVDQHPNFSGRAKGGTSGRDFLIYTREAERLAGGVVLNIGSAVTGPEVLLKATSMVCNVGSRPTGLVTADFDLRPHDPKQMTDEDAFGYYFRDQKSIVTRVPASFGGKGFYVQGNQKDTFPALYRALRQLAEK